MKLIMGTFICLFLLSATGLYAESDQQPTKKRYFDADDFPMAWPAIAPYGETIIVEKAKNRNVRVIIRARNRQVGAPKNRRPAGSLSNCMYGHCIEIAVNGKQIVVPYSVYCDLYYLSRGRIFVEGGKMFLLLAGGDGSTAHYVKIAFDQKRVTRRIRYAFSSMYPSDITQETTYHIPQPCGGT